MKSNRTRLAVAGCCLAVVLVLPVFFEAYQRNTYFDLNCGRMEKRVVACGRVISREPVESATAQLYAKFVGPLPAGNDWKLCYSGGYNIYGGKVLSVTPAYDGLPSLNYILPIWFDDSNYPDGPGINYMGITDAAKGELLLRTLQASRLQGRDAGGRKYLDRAAEAVLWLDHIADVEDLPAVADVLDDHLWREIWEPRIEQWEPENRAGLPALAGD